MKKVIVLSVVLVSLLSACKKKKCWTCYVSVHQSSNSNYGSNTNATSTTQVCDKTDTEIQQYEKAGSSTTTSHSGNITVTQTITTSCR